MSRRTIREPYAYLPAVEVASALQQAAREIELGSEYVRFSLQLTFATKEEVEEARTRLERKGRPDRG